MFLFTEVLTLVKGRNAVKLLDGFPLLGIGRQEIVDILQIDLLYQIYPDWQNKTLKTF